MNIIFPESKIFFSDLILQRTDGFIKCGGREVLDRWFKGEQKDHLIDFLINNDKYEEYMKITMGNYLKEVDEFIKIYKITNGDHLVSIGPGNGVFETLLLKKIKFINVLLIDIEDTKSQKHGFNHKGSGYASLASTKLFLVNNGIPIETIKICNPRIHNIPKFKFDLLISLYSMGFHYPCNEYVDFIIKNSSLNSKIIYDKRRKVIDIGHDKLENNFKYYKKIQKLKHDRVCMLKI